MRFKFSRSIMMSIMIKVSVLTCASLFLLSLTAIIVFRDYAKRQIISESKVLAQSQASYISDQFNRSAASLNALAYDLETVASSQYKDRRLGRQMTENAIRKTPSLYAAWFLFDKNAFDNHDIQYVNSDWGNDIGRYGASFNRSTGMIKYDVSDEDTIIPGDGDWFLIPMHTQKATLTDPYTYSYYEKSEPVYESSYAIPIFKSGKAIGVVGIDISLDFLSSLVKKIHPYGSGYAEVITGSGLIAAHRKSSLWGKKAGSKPLLAGVGRAITEDKVISLTGYDKKLKDTTLTVIAPIKVGNASECWAMCVIIPLSKAMAPVARLTHILVGLSVILLVLCLVLARTIAKSISTPIRRARQIAQFIASGDIDEAEKALKSA